MSEFVFRGQHEIDLASDQPRRLTLIVKSAGVSLLVGNSADGAELIYSGAGVGKVRASVRGATLYVWPYHKDGIVKLDVPELRDAQAGWTNEPSLTDLEPPQFGAVSAEMEALLQKVNRNAVIREQQLIRAIKAGLL